MVRLRRRHLAFGDARFVAGSMAGERLNSPVQSLVPDADDGQSGYWLVASDCASFASSPSDAPFKGRWAAPGWGQPVTAVVRYGDATLMVGETAGVLRLLLQSAVRRFAGKVGPPPARPIRVGGRHPLRPPWFDRGPRTPPGVPASALWI